jgi:hypothetical protein
MTRLVEKYQSGDKVDKPELKGVSMQKKVNPDGSETYVRNYAGSVEAPPAGGDITLPGGKGGDDSDFDKAFATARKAGDTRFEFDGQSFNTDISPEFKNLVEERVSTVPTPLEGKGLPQQQGSVTPTPVQSLAPRKNPLHELVDFQWAGGLGEGKYTMNMQEGNPNRYAVSQRDHLKDLFNKLATPEAVQTMAGTKDLISQVNKEFKKGYEGKEKFRGQLQFTGRGLK